MRSRELTTADRQRLSSRSAPGALWEPKDLWAPCALLVLALCALSTTTPASAQPNRDGSIGEEINVSLVTIDVFVTDKKGRPVDELTLDDFIVREDGRPVDIESFRSVRSSGAATDAAGTRTVESPLTVIAYIDEALMLPTDLARLKGEIAGFFERSVPAGSGMVLARHGEALDVVVPYTELPAVIVEGLRGMVPNDGAIANFRGADRAFEAIELQDLLYSERQNRFVASGSEVCDSGWSLAVSEARAFAAEAQDRLAGSADSLARFISGLSGIPGRKALLYVSGGLQLQPGSEVLYALGDFCPDRQSEVASLIQEYQQATALNQLAAHANANRVTIYPLDAAGVRQNVGGSRSNIVTQANLQDALVLLGRETGGRTILNANKPAEALADLSLDFHRYYEISYRPDRQFQAPNHQVDVRLANSGNRQVRYRRTVRPKSTEEMLAERLISALVLGVEDNPLGVELSFGTPEASGPRLVRVPVQVRVPKDKLLLLDGEEEPSGGLRLFLVARDDKNRGSELREHFVEPTNLVGAGDVLEYVINIELEPSTYEVAVGVRDERAKRASYLRQEVVARVSAEAKSAKDKPGKTVKKESVSSR